MKELTSLVRNNIQQLAPYSSARDEFEGNGEVFLDANENPYDCGFNRYPDPYQRQLKSKLANMKGVAPSQLFLGNGSDEAIDLTLRIFCEPGRDNIIVTDPTYGMYAVSAAINNIEVIKVPLTERFDLSASSLLSAVNEYTKVIFICSPNNPSGNSLNMDEIDKVITSFEGIVVVDEAYIDFSTFPSYSQKLDRFPNLIVLQTFSKAWGIAGLRLGIAYATEPIISWFNKVKPPYNINTYSQQIALEKLDEEDKVRGQIAEILAQRDRLQEELKKLPIVMEVFPSDTNFLLVRFTEAQKIFRYLVDREIIVRDRSKVKFGANCLRITVGTPSENSKLLEALKNFNI